MHVFANIVWSHKFHDYQSRQEKSGQLVKVWKFFRDEGVWICKNWRERSIGESGRGKASEGLGGADGVGAGFGGGG